MKKPDGYHTIIPYLILKNAVGFLDFTKKLFNAVEVMKVMDEDKIKHAEIKIDDTVIMFAESSEQWQPNTAGFFIYVDDADKTYKEALSLGAKSINEPSDQEYGRSGGVTDPFGNTWWVTSVK